MNATNPSRFKKVYGGDGRTVTPRNDNNLEKKVRSENLSVEEMHTPEQLKHIHNCIHFTHQFLQAESDAKNDV